MLQPVEGIKQGGRSVQSRLTGGEVCLDAGKRDDKGTIQGNQVGYTIPRCIIEKTGGRRDEPTIMGLRKSLHN